MFSFANNSFVSPLKDWVIDIGEPSGDRAHKWYVLKYSFNIFSHKKLAVERSKWYNLKDVQGYHCTEYI